MYKEFVFMSWSCGSFKEQSKLSKEMHNERILQRIKNNNYRK